MLTCRRLPGASIPGKGTKISGGKVAAAGSGSFSSVSWLSPESPETPAASAAARGRVQACGSPCWLFGIRPEIDTAPSSCDMAGGAYVKTMAKIRGHSGMRACVTWPKRGHGDKPGGSVDSEKSCAPSGDGRSPAFSDTRAAHRNGDLESRSRHRSTAAQRNGATDNSSAILTRLLFRR